MVLMAFEKGYCCEIPKHKKKDCVAAEVIQGDNEEEGPVNDWKLKTVYTHELDYDCFYLGLKRYEYDCIPNSIGIKPEDPSKSMSFGKQYDKPDGWSTTMRNYELKLREWKVMNLVKIKKMNYKELSKWKRDYRLNEKSKREFAFPMIETSKRDSNILYWRQWCILSHGQ